jgi:hypothetical protein
MDILIDPYRFTIAAPACAEQLVMVKQTQSFGGVPVDDGFPQVGPAVTARASFLAGLQAHTSDDLSGLTATSTNYGSTLLSLWGGDGQIAGGNYAGVGALFYISSPLIGTNGRFNTSANVSGNWGETSTGWQILLPAPRTAFGCYVMDLGDVREGEVEFRFYNGSTLTRIVAPPTVPADKPRTNEAMWIGYADGNRPFTRIEAHVRQYNTNPSQRDFVGFDDLAIGDVIACVPSALPAVFYGANTTGDTAKTVTGAAQTARNSWVASAGTPFVCDFEAVAVGTVLSNTAIGFANGASTFNASFFPVQYTATHAISASADAIDNNVSSVRWNTTPSGSKWYELNDELTIVFPAARSSFGFYATDLGDQNATLRVTFRRANGSGVSYYLPKATALPGAASLLRFWGVTGELPFVSVVLQTVYYTNLTADAYNNPVNHLMSPRDVVGIDDIMVS